MINVRIRSNFGSRIFYSSRSLSCTFQSLASHKLLLFRCAIQSIASHRRLLFRCASQSLASRRRRSTTMSLSKPVGMHACSCMPSRLAVRALWRFRTNGLAIDPENPEHVNAYQVLRKNTGTKGAVNGKTLLAYVNSLTPPGEHGAQSYVKYWGVPKANFAGGLLPTYLLPSMHTPASLEEAGVLAYGSIDHDQFYVIDKSVDRTRLGSNLRTFKFFTGSTTTLNTRQAGNRYTGSTTGLQSHNQPAAANPQIIITAPDAPTHHPVALPPHAAPVSQPHAASSSSQPQAANTRRTLKLRCTDDDGAVDEPPAKTRKRRLAETMAVLRASIASAAEDKKWHSSSAWANNTVTFYVNEIITVMQTLAQEAHAAGQSPAASLLLIDKVWNFIASQLQEHAHFKDLCHFQDIFDKFSAMGATPTGTIKILVKMIAAKATCVCVCQCVCVWVMTLRLLTSQTSIS